MAYRYDSVRYEIGTNPNGFTLAGPIVRSTATWHIDGGEGDYPIHKESYSIRNNTDVGFNVVIDAYNDGDEQHMISLADVNSLFSPLILWRNFTLAAGQTYNGIVSYRRNSSSERDYHFRVVMSVGPVNSGHPNVIDNAGTWKGYLWRNV